MSNEFLRNEKRDARLNEVVTALCVEMLIAGGLETDADRALVQVNDAVTSGRAAEIFGRMVRDLGGPQDVVDNFEQYLPIAQIQRPVYATAGGYVSKIDAFAVGNAIIELGGGRRTMDDELDLSVGLSDVDRPLAIVHATSEKNAALAASILCEAVTVRDTAPDTRPIIYESLS